MLVILLFLFSTNGFMSTAAGDEALAVASTSKMAPPEPPKTCNNNGTLTCGDDEVLDECPSYCPSDFCPTGDGQNKRCPQPNPCPPPACKCRFNSRRAQNGKCIPTRSCPAFDCPKPNEVYDPCPPLCPTDSCSQATPTGKCPLLGRIGIILECNPTCRCKKGFWRIDNGTCVPYNQCPGKLTCGPNEVVDNCPVDCESDYCPTSDKPERSCPKPCQCPPPACKCAPNYRRAQNGTCIPIGACRLNCTGPHEYYACGGACDNVCKDLHIQSQDNCPIINIKCNDMCYCEKGFARDDKGICIPISDCPKKKPDKRCPFPNEEYTECKRKCPSDRCSSVVERCVPSQTCSPGCVCLPGFLRKKDGQPCIPQCQCPELAQSTCN